MADPTPTCHRVRLPAGAEGALTVYKNGAEVREGADFTVEDGCLVFREPLHRGRKTGFLGRMQMTVVGVGVYEQVDKIDIHLARPDGRLEIFPELEAEPEG